MKRIQATLHWVIVASAASHIFCCVLPTMFALVSFFTGLGLFSVLPAFENLHHVLHSYEVPMIIMAAVMLSLGWSVQYYSWQIDCHDTGCGHGSCKPKKRRAEKMLLIATGLFVFNMAVFIFGH